MQECLTLEKIAISTHGCDWSQAHKKNNQIIENSIYLRNNLQTLLAPAKVTAVLDVESHFIKPFLASVPIDSHLKPLKTKGFLVFLRGNNI